MPKLRIILQSKYFYFILILITLLYIYYFNTKVVNSKYSGYEDTITGIVKNLKFDGNKLSIELKAKENIIVNYYFEDKEELLKIKQDFCIGDKLTVIGKLIKPSENTIFNLFNYQKYLKSKKIFWLFQANNIKKLNRSLTIQYKFRNYINKRINQNINSDYLRTFILGDTSLIAADIKSSYQLNGISHLFAISGMHITLFSTILLFILNKLSQNKVINYLFVILFLLLYAFLTNYTPSVTRAVLLFILCAINKYYNLNIKTSYLLIIICSLLLFYNPFYIYNLGFLFSFIITFYLITFSDLINESSGYFNKLFKTSLISFLASLPIIINNFFSINLLSIIYNLFFVGYVSYVIFPLSLITFILPDLSFLLTFFLSILESVSLLCSKITFLTITLSHLNIYLFIGYYILITISLYFIRLKKYFPILILGIVLFIHHNILFFNKYAVITMLDVGQGDCLLVKLPHNKGNILIDTGGIIDYSEDWEKRKNPYSIAINKIIPYLKSVGVNKVNYLILSHGDYDHMGEAINLVENFKVGKVIFNSDSYNELEQEFIQVLKKKNIKYYKGLKELNIDKYKIQFLNTKIYDNENDNSNVIYFNYKNFKFLFMGDAGIDKEMDLLDKYNLDNIDFLKVGHHGSNTSSSEEFINSINPKYSLISVGKNNRYGHPKESVLENLFNSKIYRTDIDGSIEIKLNKNGYKIRTCTP